jgi:hypothetical protein
LKGVIGDGPRKINSNNKNKFDFQVFENKSMAIVT